MEAKPLLDVNQKVIYELSPFLEKYKAYKRTRPNSCWHHVKFHRFYLQRLDKHAKECTFVDIFYAKIRFVFVLARRFYRLRSRRRFALKNFHIQFFRTNLGDTFLFRSRRLLFGYCSLLLRRNFLARRRLCGRRHRLVGGRAVVLLCFTFGQHGYTQKYKENRAQLQRPSHAWGRPVFVDSYEVKTTIEPNSSQTKSTRSIRRAARRLLEPASARFVLSCPIHSPWGSLALQPIFRLEPKCRMCVWYQRYNERCMFD